MSFLAPQFQITSDLHLETPLSALQYGTTRLDVYADNLSLLGDNGLAACPGLLHFLRRLLEQSRGCRLLYILGNHEPYRTTYEHAHSLLCNFGKEAKGDFDGRFKFLCRDRYDLNSDITILGCTLWSAIEVIRRLTSRRDPLISTENVAFKIGAYHGTARSTIETLLG